MEVTPEEVDRLVPIAAELIGSVRDYGVDTVAAVLARVPDGRHDALAVVLAAMVDPDARPSQLLAWMHAGPVQSREEFTPSVFREKREWANAAERLSARVRCECGVWSSRRHLARHRRTHVAVAS